VNTDEVTAPGRVSTVAQQASGTRTRPGSNATRMWDLDEFMFDAHGNKGVDGLLPTDRPMVFKVYGSYTFKFGTNVGLYFYSGSVTPVTRHVNTVLTMPVIVDGRGSMGRTPFLSQTDLYVSHDIKFAKSRRVRLEANVQNLFNQQQVRHVFDSMNRIGANGRNVNSSSIDIRKENLLVGYDYNALLLKTPDATKTGNAGFLDPRFGAGDIWNPGTSARFGVRFMF